MATGNGKSSVASLTDENKSIEGLNLEIIQGEVLMVYPGLGVYLVLPKHGDPAAGLLTCCSISGSLGRSGVRGADVYEAGDDVLVACHRVADTQDLSTGSTGEVGYIMCPAPPDFMSTAQGYPGANIHGESLDYFNQLVSDTFASTKQLISTVKDLSFGLPNDVFGGDFVKYGPLHTFLAVCATKTSIGASPMAILETFAFHDKLRITARSLQDRSIAVESGREPDESEMLYYERLAMTEREGMGAIGPDTIPFVETDPGLYEPADKDNGQIGVFRHTRLRGKSADGDIEAITAPQEEDIIHIPGDDTKPVGKVSVRQTYDGRHETRAAGGIDHIKTMYIPVPEQIKQHDKDTPNDFNPEEPYDEEFQTSDSDPPFSAFASTLENKEFDQDTEKFRNSRTNARSDYWQTLTREELAEKYPDLDIENAPKQMDALDSDKSFYDEPPMVKEVDPVTELERRLYALESIIRQQPDGSIVISDGHGSEISMHRGRITISPAADLELRPGRDCLELVPRRKVINAGEEVQIVANEGNVRIKAETDVDVLAGNGGQGRILVENRAESGTTGESSDGEDPGGIVLRSETDLRVMGTDLYFGLLPPNNTNPEDANANGLERGRTGTIVIDSRGGDVGIHGNKLYARTEAGISFSSQNSLMAIAGGVYTVIANRSQMAGPLILGTTEEGSIDQYILDEHGISLDVLEQQNANASLQVAGSIQAASLTLQGNIQAASILSASAAFGNASLTSGLFGGEIEPPQFDIDPFSVESLSNFAEGYSRRVESADITDANLLKSWFQFDRSEDVDQKDFIMYEMRWQAMMGVAGSGNAWSPKTVQTVDGGDSYAYPGYSEDDTVLVSAELGKRPMKDYIVNS